MTHVLLRGVPMPSRLHLLLNPDGSPALVRGDRGQREYSAYTNPADAPGPTRAATRAELIMLETGLDVVWVDQADPSGPGLPLACTLQRQPWRPVPAADGVVVDLSQLPRTLWRTRLLATLGDGDHAYVVGSRARAASLTLVVSEVPSATAAAAAEELRGLPHPDILVSTADDPPRAWRHVIAAASLPK